MNGKNKKRKGIAALSIGAIVIVSATAIFILSNAGKPQNQHLLAIVKAYADAMIENGRDTYGIEHSPLFASALDRNTMKLGSADYFGSIPGVREGDRSLGGANPQEDMALFEILYDLTRITGDSKYAREADKALKFFFDRCQSPVTGLMTWGEHLFWDFHKESSGGRDLHEVAGEWPFWDQSYRLSPEASWRFAIGQWDHQIADKATGDFSRHARWSTHGPGKGFDFPRYAGQMILNWADAYVREENANRERRNELLDAISTVVARMEENMTLTASGYLPAGRAEAGDHLYVVWKGSNLELARCLWKSIPYLQKEDSDLADRMRKLALQQDYNFHKSPHEITSGGGFAVTLHSMTGEPRVREMNKPFTAVWATGYGHSTHANMANLCFTRYEQLLDPHPELAQKYKVLILAAAEQYLLETPDIDQLQKPDAYARVIELMINAYDLTGDKRFIERAEYFSEVGINLFLDDGLPLPKATNQHSHYETITGGPDFMHALLQLYAVSR
jgi:hypothetical protein